MQIKEIAPGIPVLIMSMYPEDQYALRVLKSGAAGYLTKETIHDDIVRAIAVSYTHLDVYKRQVFFLTEL